MSDAIGARFAALDIDVWASQPVVKDEPKQWLNLVTGQNYDWNEERKVWVPTGEFPYGADPMGLINGS